PDRAERHLVIIGDDCIELDAGRQLFLHLQVCALLKGKGRIVVLMGEPFHAAARARTQDISDVIDTPDCKGLQIVERQAAYWSSDYADQ
ncbi:hypothetical protein ACC676_38830, partial [Rhizobium ruizarguesonis]